MFPAFPKGRARWYRAYNTSGEVIDTFAAATVMHWHFERLRADGEETVFAPVEGELCSREERCRWLRESLLAAMLPSESKAREAVTNVTPHSWRPGIAGDLLRDGTSLSDIIVDLRWQSTRSARTYSERLPLSAMRTSTAFRIIAR